MRLSEDSIEQDPVMRSVSRLDEVNIEQKNADFQYVSGLFFDKCGSGGNRTLVRTRKPYAFYMLILDFVFVPRQDPSHQSRPYPLKLHPAVEARRADFRFNLRRLISGFGTTSSERRLVLSPGDGIEPQSTILRLGSESILVVAN